MDNRYIENINKHYADENLTEVILDYLKQSGVDPEKLTREDIAHIEEFHIGGRIATRELADFVKLTKDAEILDLGCGIGGPARTLADEYDCQITGIDLTKAYIRTATDLTKLIGLEQKVEFICDDATNLSFDSREFDYVWLMHMTMNIEDKARLFREAYRVLKPAGQLVFYEIIKLNDKALHYPVFWAETDELNFLINEENYRNILKDSGFVEEQWEDRTRFAIDWFENRVAEEQKNSKNSRGSFTIHRNTPAKAANMLRNLKEQQIAVIRAIFSKS